MPTEVPNCKNIGGWDAPRTPLSRRPWLPVKNQILTIGSLFSPSLINSPSAVTVIYWFTLSFKIQVLSIFNLTELINWLFLACWTDFIDIDEAMEELDKRWYEIAPHLFFYNYSVCGDDEKANISKKIREFYLGDEPISKTTASKVTEVRQNNVKSLYFSNIFWQYSVLNWW